MNWTEQQTESRQRVAVTDSKAKEYDEAKKNLPVVQKEADGGVRPFETISLQPIKGVNTFEAEFGVKGEDVIFHIWPYGYHDVERKNEGLSEALRTRLPVFEDKILEKLTEVFKNSFGAGRTVFSFDGDMGSWFAKVRGAGLNQFHRKLCIEAATSLHVLMGGEV